jgi:hypothetical protein
MIILTLLFLSLSLYFNVVRFTELRQYTTLRTLKEYFTYEKYVSVTMNVTLILIYVIFVTLHEIKL